ncbi:MAG: CHASE2 domain-containing protein [Symploca sp. SIO2B6]|nr:CHASE2 domain-containing protein [Symploca sp. SIO2B6]
MGKLVVLKIVDGSSEQGFTVTLQIGEEGRNPSSQITGTLPAAPEISQYYSGWSNAYRSLGSRYRLEAKAALVTNVSKVEICCQAAQALKERLNVWLKSESFRPIREKLLEQLIPSDEIRLIIQTENIWLRRLPWHLWDICDRYPKAEISLSVPAYENVEQFSKPQSQVRILAILGNSIGINTEADRLLLEQLPDAQVSFLVEPQRQELTQQLWRQGWDIIFFAGHSSSGDNGETGRIYINQTECLTVEQLKYALKKAVTRGLKIAIFNSCDGLGLARNLADLHIPQVIVMREPVPDVVAQEFLKSFLESFALGESFYLAVREARERLQGLEDQFPCATWLPVIFQNPAAIPPTWQGLLESLTNQASANPDPNLTPAVAQSSLLRDRVRAKPRIINGRVSFTKVLLLSVATTFLVILARQLGLLQAVELQAFDHLMRSRPAERPDTRLLVVEVTEADIRAQRKEPGRGSLSDPSLARLLEILESHQPRAIGLDIYRDFPVSKGYPDLAKRLKYSDHFVAVCKVSNPQKSDPGVLPPPEVPKSRQGFADVVIDPDSVLRRHLFSLTLPPTSGCNPSFALSAQLAFRYLETEGILPELTKEKNLKLGDIVFKPLNSRAGGYQNLDARGHQVLLNYRYHTSAEDFVPKVTLSQVLTGKVNPEAVRDKIILIGATAPSANDYFLTPYSADQDSYRKMPGVVVQAQMVSQMISAVLDKRPLLWVLPEWVELLWIWSWSLVGGIIFWRFQSWQRWGLIAIALGNLYAISLVILIQGGWVPLVPPALVLLCAGSAIVAYRTLR